MGVSLIQMATPRLVRRTPPALSNNQRLTNKPGDNHLNHWLSLFGVWLRDSWVSTKSACLNNPIDIRFRVVRG